MTEKSLEDGQTIEDFLNTKLGKFIVERADAGRMAAIAEFSLIDVTNVSEVQRLQNAINMTDLIMHWFQDAIMEYNATKIEIDKTAVLSDSY